jgi:SAM-dependent methyltransferase
VSEARSTLNEHFRYLSDETRLDVYRRALETVVTPASIVVDLGCGTGVLGWLACQAGAKRVYAIDRTGMIDVARQMAIENGCADRIVHLRGSSRDVVLPEPADVVVADQMGPLGFDAGMAGDFADAASRMLRPGGRLIPGEVVTWLAPVEAPDAWRAVDRWGDVAGGMHTGAMRRKAANITILSPGGEATLAEPRRFLSFAQGDDVPAAVARAPLAWTIARGGTLHGLLGWFTATLTPGVTITNGPSDGPRLQRVSRLFPIDPAIDVREGDVVQAELIAGLPQRFFIWRVTVQRGGEVMLSVEQSTLRGRLLSSEDLSIDGAQTS